MFILHRALHDVVKVVKAGKALHRRIEHVHLAIAQMIYLAERKGWTRFVAMQNHYNLR